MYKNDQIFVNAAGSWYQCRAEYTSINKFCDARYIKADRLENVVWEKVKGVLSNPEVLLSEVSKLTESEKAQVSAGNLEQEI